MSERSEKCKNCGGYFGRTCNCFVPENAEPREWWIETKYTGHRILVDDEDRAFLERFTWHVRPNKKTFYVYTNVKIGNKNHTVSMHRLVCGLVSSMIDHKNRNGLDNRKVNLRFCTAKQNSRNSIRKNTHGYRGVWKPKGGNTYAIQIMGDNKRHAEYGFETAEAAARRYDELSKELHGEFGIRNFKD